MQGCYPPFVLNGMPSDRDSESFLSWQLSLSLYVYIPTHNCVHVCIYMCMHLQIVLLYNVALNMTAQRGSGTEDGRVLLGFRCNIGALIIRIGFWWLL